MNRKIFLLKLLGLGALTSAPKVLTPVDNETLAMIKANAAAQVHAVDKMQLAPLNRAKWTRAMLRGINPAWREV